jgi:ABC-type molybdate transport system substrate-binding protein
MIGNARVFLLCITAVAMAGCDRPPTQPTAKNMESRVDPSGDLPINPERKSGTSKGTGRLRIAAASDLKFALEPIVAAFQREHPNAQVTVTLGSSGNFFAQLSNEAPYDLFLSADIEYARRLVAEGKAEPAKHFPTRRDTLYYGSGKTLAVRSTKSTLKFCAIRPSIRSPSQILKPRRMAVLRSSR